MNQATEVKIKEVIKQFEETKPRDYKEAVKMKLSLRFLGDGCYRNTYRIGKLPLVIKFPKHCAGKNHSTAEYKAIKSIKRFKKFEKLKQFMPIIYYFDAKTGIMIMHHYKSISQTVQYAMGLIMEELVEIIWPYSSGYECDVHGSNMGLDESNKPVLTDLGYFSDLGKSTGGW